ncbi:hypothetical protein [Streptomyces aureoversilis]|uniref:Uncharacterized protein n=1 Tax=Streptomyces aureoversilis TaxID=67277 RepID=A0ABW0AB83_9ACTN
MTRIAEAQALPDWLELARLWLSFGRFRPRTDPEVLSPAAQSVLTGIRRAVAELDDEALRTAALEFVPRGWLVEALADALLVHAADRDDACGSTPLWEEDGRREEERRLSLATAAEYELQAVTTDAPASWGPAVRPALTCAVVWRAATLAAVSAHVAGEPEAPHLSWKLAGPGHWVATTWLPGATHPVTVEISERTASSERPVGRLPLAVEGAFRWSVTWNTGSGACVVEAGNSSGLGYAQWHAGQFLTRMRNAPGGARHAGRLLIPVVAGAADRVVVPVRTLGLGEVLDAVFSRFGQELTAPLLTEAGRRVWLSLPHSLGREPVSAVAAILADLEAPVPEQGEEVNRAMADEAAFTSFLAAHAVALTAGARAYLAGLADSGPGPDSIGHRHQAAMRSLLALLETSPQAAAAAEWEIGPPPAGGYRTLLDPEHLGDHVRFHAPRGDRPEGVTPSQLAMVREEICQGVAATTTTQMRSFFHGHFLPDPPVRFAVSFRITDDPTEADLSYAPEVSPGTAELCLPATADWSERVAAGEAVLAGLPVTEVLRRDRTGRPDVVRIVEPDVLPQEPEDPDDRVVRWDLKALTRIVNVDWSTSGPRLFTPAPAGGR